MANPLLAERQAGCPTPLSPALALKLRALDAQFRTGLHQRLAEANSPATASAALHRLVGAAGTYGHAALAGYAREAMEALAAGPAQADRHAAAMQGVATEIKKLLA